MRLTILGCWGGFPQAGGATSGYLIETSEGRILLECGSGVFSQLAFYHSPAQINAVILSHLHYDHIADIHILQYAIRGATRRRTVTHTPIPLYLPVNSPDSFLRELEPEFECIRVIPERTYFIVGSEVSFMPTSHTIECYAVRLKSNHKIFAYSADSAPDDRLTEIAHQADLFLCESTMVTGSQHSSGEGHMGPQDAARIAHAAKAQKLVLTHLPSDGDLMAARALAQNIFSGLVELANLKAVHTI